MNSVQAEKLKKMISVSGLLNADERAEWSALLALMNDKQAGELEKILAGGQIAPPQAAAALVKPAAKPFSFVPPANIPVQPQAALAKPLPSPVVLPKPLPASSQIAVKSQSPTPPAATGNFSHIMNFPAEGKAAARPAAAQKTDGILNRIKQALAQKELPPAENVSSPRPSVEAKLPAAAPLVKKIPPVPPPAPAKVAAPISVSEPTLHIELEINDKTGAAGQKPEVTVRSQSSTPQNFSLSQKFKQQDVAAASPAPVPRPAPAPTPEPSKIYVVETPVQSPAEALGAVKKSFADMDAARAKEAAIAAAREPAFRKVDSAPGQSGAQGSGGGMEFAKFTGVGEIKASSLSSLDEQLQTPPAEKFAPPLLRPGSASLPSLEAAAGLGVNDFEKSGGGGISRALKQLIAKYGYEEVMLNLEHSGLYQSYLNTGVKILKGNGSFENLGQQFLTKERFEEFADVLRDVRAAG